jgi:NAD(P)-dependent dehydrogenase (short-subunit alcohol dehydrogenase family)
MTNNNAGRFAGKVALVTGAGSGIGAAVAAKLISQGATHVVLADVNGVAAKDVAQAWPNASAVAVDVASPEQVDSVFADVVDQHGGIDVVVHAAGVDDPVAKQAIADALVAGAVPQLTSDLTDEAWRRVLSINLDGTFFILRAALRAMTPRGSGSVVVVGSSAAFDAPTAYPHYSASKAGVHALSQAVAKEAIAFGIRINVVAPGPTETGMAARTPAALRGSMSDPRVRPYASPDELADVALFLASNEAANVVGAVVLANGGRCTV